MTTRKDKSRFISAEEETIACFSVDEEDGMEPARVVTIDPWLEDLIAQKRHISQLREKLDILREETKNCRKQLQSAEARLLAIIEEVGQERLPLQ
jgi:hypothetical protein